MCFSKQQVDGPAELLCSREAGLQDCQFLSLLDSIRGRHAVQEGQCPDQSAVLCLFVDEKEKKKLSQLIPRHFLLVER